ncbi:MAG: hypothetical protein AB7K24_02030 [Gemmataceae bacterium]
MARTRQATAQDLMRMDEIAKHLQIKSRYPASDFTTEVTEACLSRVAPVVDRLLPCTGEQIVSGIGEYLHLKFEEVYTAKDIQDLEARYLQGKKEIGFAQLRGELEQPGIDALLFQRMNAKERDADQWVAVLNLQESSARGYWSRCHELSHRVAEPPQQMLPLRRHQFEASNPVEALIDAVAAEIAFYAPAFCPLVQSFAVCNVLHFGIVDAIRARHAPTASLLSTIKAIVKHWPRPAAALIAEHRSRRNKPGVDEALRITPQGYSRTAREAGLMFIPNMRVPVASPIHLAQMTGLGQDEFEQLGNWSTSQGATLANLAIRTSARRIGSQVYALISA